MGGGARRLGDQKGYLKGQGKKQCQVRVTGISFRRGVCRPPPRTPFAIFLRFL